MGWVNITTLDNTINAHILRSKLENSGIPCFLNNEHVTNLMPYYYNILGSGVQVMVPSDKVDKAKTIAHINQSSISCPNCGSFNLSNKIEKVTNKIKLFIIVLFFVAPIGNLLNNYKCHACGEEFKK